MKTYTLKIESKKVNGKKVYYPTINGIVAGCDCDTKKAARQVGMDSLESANDNEFKK